jgi:hypothetical protein
MAIILRRLQSTGPDLPDAELAFHAKRFLIRGPSETGKSYIRDCLWYLLGGDKLPKSFPLAEGYQELRLRFTAHENEYEVRRALRGGGAAVYRRPLGADDEQAFEPLDQDVGELLVDLSGARGKQILRSMSERGPVTGDDVRHWSLLSQTAILSEEPTSGTGFGIAKRVASFNLFLSGTDDIAVQLRKSSAEVERIKGQLSSAEDAFQRIQAGLSTDAKRDDVADALERVDEVLSAMTSQYDARATKLRELRREVADKTDKLSVATNERNHSRSMIGRFEMLEQKYSNDLERLGATNEGVAFFQELPKVPCPLCGTPTESQVDPNDLRPDAPNRYRAAIAAEAEKIRSLRHGLLAALDRERRRFSELKQGVEGLSRDLSALQNRESIIVNGARIEFSADPKSLAVRRSELSAQLAIFDEMERLAAEIERLKKSKVRSKVQVSRDGGTSGRAVADLSLSLLQAWGFTDIANIALDAEQCDLLINDRQRLSYGAGRRALYLAALTIALMEHALGQGHPHLGVVVIDSPLKAYADPNSEEPKEVPLTTVTERFYAWLSEWDGLGQVVVLENEKIRSETANILDPVEFTGIVGIGRAGFYPNRATQQHSGNNAETGGDSATGNVTDDA